MVATCKLGDALVFDGPVGLPLGLIRVPSIVSGQWGRR